MTTNLKLAEPERVVRAFIDRVVNGGDVSAIPELWAENLAWYGGSLGETHGLEAFMAQMSGATGSSFENMQLTVDETIVAGNKVVLRFRNSGTQVGAFLGSPATGRHAEWLGIGIYTVEHGKIVEAWFGEDMLGMLIQLGAVDLAA